MEKAFPETETTQNTNPNFSIGSRRLPNRPRIQSSDSLNRFLIRFRIGQIPILKKRPANEDKGDRQSSAPQIRKRRRRKVRKRRCRGWKRKKGSIGSDSGMEKRKAARKKTNRSPKRVKNSAQNERKGVVSFPGLDKEITQLMKSRLRAKVAIDVDRALIWMENGFPALQESKGEERDDEQVRVFGLWSTPIGYGVWSSPLRMRKREVRMRGRRKRVYGGDEASERARWCEVLGLCFQCRQCKVVPSLLVYLNTIWDAFITHNHPSLFLHLKTIRLYVYLLVLDYSLVGIRSLFQFSSSVFMNHMEKGSGKLIWGSGFPNSNNMSISSSSNQSGINTQGHREVEISNLNEISKSSEFNIDREGNQPPQIESLDAQLEKIRLESLEFKKSNSLMGFVCGNTTEFKKVKLKLLSIWRLNRGEVQIYERGHGWFECTFRNTNFLNRVWNGRPYHVMGHLLLLRPWRVDFSTKIENTNVLDLWIRIFHLPSTLACHNGVKLILEENGLGKFIKFDRASGVFFAGACVNIDIDKHVPGDVRISDNEDHPLLLVWFEDFPHGCGNCGKLDHIYKNCPLKKFNPRKISITIVRKDAHNIVPSPNEKTSPIEEDEGWVLVNNTKKRGSSSSTVSKKAQSPVGEIPGSSVKGKEVVSYEQRVVRSEVAQPEKEMNGGEIFSSPTTFIMENDKEEGEIDEEMEGLLEKVGVIDEDQDIPNQKRFIEELERDLLSDDPPEMMQKLKMIPTNSIQEVNNNSNSDSLKRKGEDEVIDDTASSSLKRKKPRGFP